MVKHSINQHYPTPAQPNISQISNSKRERKPHPQKPTLPRTISHITKKQPSNLFKYMTPTKPNPDPNLAKKNTLSKTIMIQANSEKMDKLEDLWSLEKKAYSELFANIGKLNSLYIIKDYQSSKKTTKPVDPNTPTLITYTKELHRPKPPSLQSQLVEQQREIRLKLELINHQILQLTQTNPRTPSTFTTLTQSTQPIN